LNIIRPIAPAALNDAREALDIATKSAFAVVCALAFLTALDLAAILATNPGAPRAITTAVEPAAALKSANASPPFFATIR
jgi:hypothetical protein